MKTIAIVALSGGMDSCVTAASAHREHELALLHICYGQRTETRELTAFNDIADHYHVPPTRRRVIPAPHFGLIGGSSLTDPRIKAGDTGYGKGDIPATYVPFRNAFILSIAVAWAEIEGIEKIFIGVTEPDSPGYPDCRPSFIAAFNRVIETGTRPETVISIETPLISMNKAAIVRKGMQLNAPLHLTWSCYFQSGRAACGRCDSCRQRLKGFKEAGLKDPLRYKIEEVCNSDSGLT